MSEAREPLVQQIEELKRKVELAREEAASAEERAERAEQREEFEEQISALKQMNAVFTVCSSIVLRSCDRTSLDAVCCCFF